LERKGKRTNEPIVIPVIAPTEVDYEAELAVVIGKTARHVSESRALEYVLGYTCAHDVSARDCKRLACLKFGVAPHSLFTVFSWFPTHRTMRRVPRRLKIPGCRGGEIG
jgi:2-keto-4-pentenoate hydratase/2-oxohepta-3-ene-1,7-dioic acid hydratase in catechol pathway